MKFAIRLVIAVLFPIGCFAQFTVSGRVIDKADAKPLPNVNVFINNTTFGDKTTRDGFFILKDLKPGKYELVVSIIGFDTYKQTLVVNARDVKLPDIKMQARVTALKEVTIKTSGNTYRDIYYNRFKDEFLGRSSFAQETKILNPESLYFDFDEETHTLTASSSGFLEIANEALGYKISYLLANFTLSSESAAEKEVHYEGSVMFTEMNGTPAQKRRWQQRRQDAYEGSALHFLRSAMNDRLEEDGFRVLQLAVYANPNRPDDSLVRAKIKQFDLARYYHKDLKNPDSLAFWKKKEKLLKVAKIIR